MTFAERLVLALASAAVALAVFASTGVLGGDAAAQQKRPPNELWDSYPLDPTQTLPADERPQPPASVTPPAAERPEPSAPTVPERDVERDDGGGGALVDSAAPVLIVAGAAVSALAAFVAILGLKRRRRRVPEHTVAAAVAILLAGERRERELEQPLEPPSTSTARSDEPPEDVFGTQFGKRRYAKLTLGDGRSRVSAVKRRLAATAARARGATERPKVGALWPVRTHDVVEEKLEREARVKARTRGERGPKVSPRKPALRKPDAVSETARTTSRTSKKRTERSGEKQAPAGSKPVVRKPPAAGYEQQVVRATPPPAPPGRKTAREKQTPAKRWPAGKPIDKPAAEKATEPAPPPATVARKPTERATEKPTPAKGRPAGKPIDKPAAEKPIEKPAAAPPPATVARKRRERATEKAKVAMPPATTGPAIPGRSRAKRDVPSKSKPEPASPPTVHAIARRAPDDAERSVPKRARSRRVARDPKVGQVQERPAGTAAVDLAKTESERCEIGWWRGYLKSDFYAAVVTPGGDSYVVARSPLFRWRRSAPPTQIDHVVAAHRDLLGQLEREGWEYEGRGDQWYAARFRLVLGPHALRVGGHATQES